MGHKKSTHDLNKVHSPSLSKSRRKTTPIIQSGESHNLVSHSSGHSAASSNAPAAATTAAAHHNHNNHQSSHHNQQIAHPPNYHHKPKEDQHQHQQHLQNQQHPQHQQHLQHQQQMQHQQPVQHHNQIFGHHQSINSSNASKPKLIRSKPNFTKDILEIPAPSWFDYVLLLLYHIVLYSFYALFWYVMWSIYLLTLPTPAPRFKHPSATDTARLKGISRSDIEILCERPV